MENFDTVNIRIDNIDHTFYKCKIPKETKLNELRKWLNGDFLAEDYVWNDSYIPNLSSLWEMKGTSIIYFKNKEDATMFLLSFY